jgi:hypothetical protein
MFIANQVNQAGFDAVKSSIDDGAARLIEMNRELKADTGRVSAQLEAVTAKMKYQTKLLNMFAIQVCIWYIALLIYFRENNYFLPVETETPPVVQMPIYCSNMRLIADIFVSVVGCFLQNPATE